MKQRLYGNHEKTFQERLNDQAQRLRDEAAKTTPGTARDLLLRRVGQAETASQLDGWLSSSGLRPPK